MESMRRLRGFMDLWIFEPYEQVEPKPVRALLVRLGRPGSETGLNLRRASYCWKNRAGLCRNH